MPSILGDLSPKLPDPLGLFGNDRGGPGQNERHTDNPRGSDDLRGDRASVQSPGDGNGNGYAYGHDGAPGNGRSNPASGAADGRGNPNSSQGVSSPSSPAASLPAGPSAPALNAGPILSLAPQAALLPAAIVSTLFGQNMAPPPANAPSAASGAASSTPSPTVLPGGGQGIADGRGSTPNVASAVQAASQVLPGVMPSAGQLPSTLAQSVAPNGTLPTTNPHGDAQALHGNARAGGQAVAVLAQAVGPVSAPSAQATTQPAVAGQMPSTVAAVNAQSAAALAAAPAASLPAPSVATLAQATIAPAAAQTLTGGNTAQLAPSLSLPPSATADRLAARPMASLPSAVPTAVTASGTTATPAQIATLANAPLAQLPAVDPRAAVPLGPGDRGLALRAEPGMIAGYTGDGLQRRGLRSRLDSLLTSPMNQLLATLGAAGTTAARSRLEAEQRAEREFARALQWVFWVLAIVAYGSLAFTVVALMAGRGRGADIAARIQQDGNGWLAIIGLAAGIAAWWVARRLPAR